MAITQTSSPALGKGPSKELLLSTPFLLKRLGMNVDFAAIDWGTVGARRRCKERELLLEGTVSSGAPPS